MAPKDISAFWLKSLKVVMTSSPVSVIPVALAAAGTSDPCNAMDNSTIQNTMLNMSFCSATPDVRILIANTIDAAPRSPTKEISAICLRGYFLKGSRMPHTASGRATNVRNPNMTRAGSSE